MNTKVRRTLTGLCLTGLVAVGVACQSGTADASVGNIFTFANPTGITIPHLGNANPYPSTINVSPLPRTVVDVDVTLFRLSHTFSADLEIILEGPGGQRVALMVDAGDVADWTGNDVTFSDGAGALIVGSNGIFSPTGPGGSCGVAECSGAGSLLAVYNGLDPTGTWKLYINDDVGADLGSVAGGWSLTFAVPEPATLALLGLGLAGLGLARRRKTA